jgi:hypothetical protein
VTEPGATVVTVSGMPVGGAKGYHSANPFWRETPPHRWGLDLLAKTYGRTLVIASANEIRFIHHVYLLTGLKLVVPPGVKVVVEERELTGDGSPSFSPPTTAERSTGESFLGQAGANSPERREP